MTEKSKLRQGGFSPLEMDKSLTKDIRPDVSSGLSLTGFTLIEIMIVVGIIVILVAFAIPLMLRSRINANEAATLANIRTVYNSCQAYYSNNLPHTYPPNGLSDLTTPASIPAYIDSVLSSGTKQGYQYSYQFVNEEQFKLYVNPTYTNRTGVRHFFVDETGVVRQDAQNQADENDPAVE